MTSYLITGGTGSFGNAYVRHLLQKMGTTRIVIYSRDEVKQAEMREAIEDRHEQLRFFVGDVRDRDRLRRAFRGVDVVIHAAALKRIEVGNYNPDEMVKTNIIGAMNVIEAAQDVGVKKVVALSTDKAFQPVSPYGQSKALAESLFLNANNARGASGPKFAVTRYGNVAFSRGSVIPKWKEVIESDKTVQVTDPACTRFWMLMSEACELVDTAVENMPQRVLIPNLKAFTLRDLLAAMGAGSNWKKTGLPDWEKMHECLSDLHCSGTTEKMTIQELRKAIVEHGYYPKIASAMAMLRLPL